MKPVPHGTNKSSNKEASKSRKNVHPPIDTVVVETNSVFRAGLNVLLGLSRYRVVAQIDTSDYRSSANTFRKPPALIVIGTSVSASRIVETVEDLKSSYPDARFACIQRSYELQEMATLLQAGMDGLLTADIDEASLIRSLDLVMSGEIVVPQNFLALTALDRETEDSLLALPHSANEVELDTPELSSSGLSARERDILRLLTNGDTNRTIGSKLAVSDTTVKIQVKGILRKLQVRNRTQAAIWAMQNLPCDNGYA